MKRKRYYSRGTRSGYSDIDAQAIGEEIQKLMGRFKGKVKPIHLLTEAKKKQSNLHKYFEWDDKKASNKWRMYQARHILGNIVEVVVINGVESKQRSFFNYTESKSEKYYVTLGEATGNLNYKKQLLDNIIKHLENTTQLMRMFQEYKE